jgi:hypothetical protein
MMRYAKTKTGRRCVQKKGRKRMKEEDKINP